MVHITSRPYVSCHLKGTCAEMTLEIHLLESGTSVGHCMFETKMNGNFREFYKILMWKINYKHD